MNTAGTNWGTVESPVNEPNRSASFLADMINLEIPGKVLSDPYPKEFGWWNLLNRLIVEVQNHVREGVLLGWNNHGLGLAALAVNWLLLNQLWMVLMSPWKSDKLDGWVHFVIHISSFHNFIMTGQPYFLLSELGLNSKITDVGRTIN